jgi:hypothetical protein
MSDYIERETILKKLRGECLARYPPYCIMGILSAANEVANVPAADGRPVILCRDCKHSEQWYADKSMCFLWHESGIDVFNDGFCNYGVKREGGDGEKVVP